MARVRVSNEIGIYEFDGVQVNCQENTVKIMSHSIFHDRVNIHIPGHEMFTVVARDLEVAIKNATNTR